MRASSYNIYVDLPQDPDKVLLVHGYSGAYDLVNLEIGNYVRSLETRPAPRPLYGTWSPEAPLISPSRTPSEESIKHLRSRGYLTDLSEEAEEDFLKEIATTLHEGEMTGGPAYILMTTYDCNLRCAYCFQDHMRTDERYRHLLKSMSKDVVDRIINAMPQIEKAHQVSDGTPRNITFFGGEPLLEANRPTVDYIMSRLAENGPAIYSAVTNATQLEAYADILGPNGISALQITLDGPPEKHDTRRIHADGSGSFEKIAKNIDLALDKGVQVEVRTNVDRTNIEELPGLADEIIRRRWHASPNFVAYTAPISASNDKTDRNTTMTSWELDKEIMAMRSVHPEMYVISRPDEGMLFKVKRILSGKADVFESFRSSYCGAHGRMYVFDAFADIYACWEKTGDSKIRIGHVKPDGTLAMNSLTEVWRGRTIATNRACLSCRFALYCGGGCAVRALQLSGTMFHNYCDGFQSRFKAIAAEAYGRLDEPDLGAAESRLSDRTLRA